MEVVDVGRSWAYGSGFRKYAGVEWEFVVLAVGCGAILYYICTAWLGISGFKLVCGKGVTNKDNVFRTFGKSEWTNE